MTTDTTTEIRRHPGGSIDTEFYIKQGRLERAQFTSSLLAGFAGFLKGLVSRPRTETVPALRAIDGAGTVRLSGVPGDADIEQREAA